MTNYNKNPQRVSHSSGTINPPKKRRKPRRHIRPEILIGLVIVLCILVTALVLPNLITNSKLKGLGYTNTQIKEIKHEKLTKEILDNKYYSVSLANALDKKSVNSDYLELYTSVKDNRTLTAEDFLLASRLADKGYEQAQILNLFKNLEYWEITPLLVFDYQWDEKVYIDDCVLHRDTNSKDSFTLSNTFIVPNTENIVSDPSSITVLVNQKNNLPAEYVPEDLETIDLQYASQGVQLRAEAAKNFEALSAASIQNKVPFFASTGYVSYQALKDIYSSYNADVANLYADVPGQSEQQTGYAADVSPTYEGGAFSQTNTYQWLKEHAAEYGFILRYPVSKAPITGNKSETNQLRYLGKSLAKAIVDSNLTYDEYYSLYIASWSDEKNMPKENVLSATNYQKYLNEKSDD